MKLLNDKLPLVYIHIYKTGGSSINNIFRKWYIADKRFIKHNVYANVASEVRKETCTSESINQLKEQGISNPVFFGHFARYPAYTFPQECNQFITTIRDPFDQMVSGYYYSKFKKSHSVSKFPTVEDYVLKHNYNYSLNAAFEGKEKITLENFKEVLNKYFVAIGSLKNYHKTIEVFESILGKVNGDKERIINESPAPKQEYIKPEHLRSLHREMYPLEYAIYDYVNDYYGY